MGRRWTGRVAASPSPTGNPHQAPDRNRRFYARASSSVLTPNCPPLKISDTKSPIRTVLRSCPILLDRVAAKAAAGHPRSAREVGALSVWSSTTTAWWRSAWPCSAWRRGTGPQADAPRPPTRPSRSITSGGMYARRPKIFPYRIWFYRGIRRPSRNGRYFGSTASSVASASHTHTSPPRTRA